MQLCGFHYINGYSICILVIFSMYFIIYCDYCVFHREFLWLTVANQCQQVPNVIRCHDNWLIVSRIAWIPNVHCIPVHISHFLSILVNLLLTGNDMCHSQPNNILLFLMPVVQCIVAQWRHISSESAISNMLNMCSVSHQIWCPTDCMGYFTYINNCGRKSVQ